MTQLLLMNDKPICNATFAIPRLGLYGVPCGEPGCEECKRLEDMKESKEFDWSVTQPIDTEGLDALFVGESVPFLEDEIMTIEEIIERMNNSPEKEEFIKLPFSLIVKSSRLYGDVFGFDPSQIAEHEGVFMHIDDLKELRGVPKRK